MKNRRPTGQLGSRPLDMAKGILIALRGCGPDAAFDELVDTAHRHHIPLFAMSSALIAIASGAAEPYSPDSLAQQVAQREWRDLLSRHGEPTARGASR